MSASLDNLINYAIAGATETLRREKEEKAKNEPKPLSSFRVVKTAGELVGQARKLAEHHRSREKFHTVRLEEAEKEIQEKGITFEVYDPKANAYIPMTAGSFASGAVETMNWLNSNVGGSLVPPPVQYGHQHLQPKIDPVMLEKANKAREKMLEHRGKADRYEQHARAWSCAPDFKLELTITDVDWLKLGEEETKP